MVQAFGRQNQTAVPSLAAATRVNAGSLATCTTVPTAVAMLPSRLPLLPVQGRLDLGFPGSSLQIDSALSWYSIPIASPIWFVPIFQ